MFTIIFVDFIQVTGLHIACSLYEWQSNRQSNTQNHLILIRVYQNKLHLIDKLFLLDLNDKHTSRYSSLAYIPNLLIHLYFPHHPSIHFPIVKERKKKITTIIYNLTSQQLSHAVFKVESGQVNPPSGELTHIHRGHSCLYLVFRFDPRPARFRTDCRYRKFEY